MIAAPMASVAIQATAVRRRAAPALAPRLVEPLRGGRRRRVLIAELLHELIDVRPVRGHRRSRAQGRQRRSHRVQGPERRQRRGRGGHSWAGKPAGQLGVCGLDPFQALHQRPAALGPRDLLDEVALELRIMVLVLRGHIGVHRNKIPLGFRCRRGGLACGRRGRTL